MAIKGDTLFVADIDVVRLFDRTTGSPLGERAVPRATFLNDVAVAPDGTVYVSDTGLRPDFSRSNSDAIHRFLPNGKAVPVARGAALGQPNGITADSAGLVVVTWSGAVYRITGSGRRLELPSPGRAQLDGVERLADGTLIVSTWQDSSIIRLAPGDTAWTRLVGGVVSPADIGWDTRRSRLLIPVFQGDRVEIRPQP
jgi:sugar lactone lactonase YvrE